jgi:hypothetical protein
MKGKKTNTTLNMAKFRRFIDLAESANRATARPPFRFLFISEVLGLQIRHGQICWKANTPGYNFYEGPSLDSIIFMYEFPQESRWRTCPVFINGQVFPILSLILLPHQIQPCLHLMHGNLSLYDLPRSFVLS